MSLADKINDLPRTTACGTGDWLYRQDLDSQTAFWAYLEERAGEKGALAALYRISRTEGLTKSITVFKQHCKRECSCFPPNDRRTA